MSLVTVTQLFRYPIKSFPGFAVDELPLVEGGPKGDRRWMLVEPSGRFITLRKIPDLYLFNVTEMEGQLKLTFPGHGEQQFDAAPTEGTPIEVTVWSDQVNAIEPYVEVSKWLSGCLDRPCKLVYVPDDQLRQVDLDFAQAGDRVGFADGFPILVATEASLKQFNQWLTEPMSMIRYRPNIVLDGLEAWSEDHWQQLVHGDLTIDLVKPCSRCAIPTLKPDTRERQLEVMQMLSEHRKQSGGVMFGVNGIHRQLTEVTLGQQFTPVL